MRPSKLVARRWPMRGGGTAYEMSVPRDVAPADITHITLRTRGKNAKWAEEVSYIDATAPDAQRSMTPGQERWDAWKAHEKRAKVAQLETAREVFQELAEVQEWPLLWIGAWTLSAEEWAWTSREGWTNEKD